MGAWARLGSIWLAGAIEVSDVDFGDWRQVVWDSEELCWEGPWTFSQCCRHGHDVDRLSEVLEGRHKVRGNPACWAEDSPLRHELCCVLNANLEKVPAYDQMMWQLRMPDESIINVVQGQVLEMWERHGIIPRGRIPFEDLVGNGEGLVWEAGESALVFSMATFARAPRRTRFLEIAASVGAPSLVALAQGFHVWSTDLRRQNAWQRRYGAVSSFGASALKRLRTPELDLLDEGTWPKSLRFDVILLGSPFFMVGPGPELQATFCQSFQRLIDQQLAEHGVALLFLNPKRLPEVGGDLRGTYAGRCLQRGEMKVAMHQPLPGGTWRAQWLHEDMLEDFSTPARLPLVFSLRRRNETV